MSSSRSLYEQVILDHNRAPRNFGELAEANTKAEGYNALCGDQFTVYLKMSGEKIDEVGFEGSGCAISKSSASVMTTLLKGKTKEEAREVFELFHEMITSDIDAPLDEGALGKMVVFSGVRAYPIRIKCATLAWHTMLSALDGDEDSISTE